MDDLISRKAVLKAINNMVKECDSVYVTSALRNLEVIVADVPPAQPETHEERTETHSCELIDRQAAIDAMSEAYEKDEIWEDYEKRLNELPSAQHWIPCSKALPKIGNRVIGTYKNSLFKNGPYVVRIMRREKKYWVGDDEHWFLYENILAWQPLPEPYREEGE